MLDGLFVLYPFGSGQRDSKVSSFLVLVHSSKVLITLVFCGKHLITPNRGCLKWLWQFVLYLRRLCPYIESTNARIRLFPAKESIKKCLVASMLRSKNFEISPFFTKILWNSNSISFLCTRFGRGLPGRDLKSAVSAFDGIDMHKNWKFIKSLRQQKKQWH